MPLKITLAAVVLAALPSLSMAEGCKWGHDSQEAMSCAEGKSWDEATGTCVDMTMS